MRYYLEIVVDGRRRPAGDFRGYPTLELAMQAAKRKVDETLPRDFIRVMAHAGTASPAGDGSICLEEHR